MAGRRQGTAPWEDGSAWSSDGGKMGFWPPLQQTSKPGGGKEGGQ